MTEKQRSLILKTQMGDEKASEELLEANSALIWSIVQRFQNRGVDKEDLYQLGAIGFVKAIQGFDLSYGTELSTYAVPKIAGEMRRFLRDDGCIKVGRGIKKQAYLIASAREELLFQLNREPTLSEISGKTDLSEEEIAVAEAAVSGIESLQQETANGLVLENILGSAKEQEEILQRMEIQQAIEQLPEKERMVIALRYYHSMTQQECSKVVKVSQVQISRIEKRALMHLKSLIS